MKKPFASQVGAATARIDRDMLRVSAAAIQDVMEAAQTPQVAISRGATSFVRGKIPVDTKELINSLVSHGTRGAASYVSAIANLKIGMIMRFAWTAKYARRINYGFTGTDSLGRNYNQAGRFFLTDNALRFSEFVKKRSAEIFKRGKK